MVEPDYPFQRRQFDTLTQVPGARRSIISALQTPLIVSAGASSQLLRWQIGLPRKYRDADQKRFHDFKWRSSSAWTQNALASIPISPPRRSPLDSRFSALRRLRSSVVTPSR
jgi:hypothetical protein